MNKGISLSIVASFIFALMGVFVKLSAKGLSPVQIVFYRNVTGLALIGASLWLSPFVNRGNRFWLLMFRGSVGAISLYALYYNISHIA
ncbi:MAG: hypothetical protein HC896_06780 [Bacteroidales bacterium]|nr:hypothetical protein [Bacteroidales bacterium]